jgi:hypothetical protein
METLEVLAVLAMGVFHLLVAVAAATGVVGLLVTHHNLIAQVLVGIPVVVADLATPQPAH